MASARVDSCNVGGASPACLDPDFCMFCFVSSLLQAFGVGNVSSHVTQHTHRGRGDKETPPLTKLGGSP